MPPTSRVYRAPTWSWAAADTSGYAGNVNSEYTYLISIMEAHVTSLGGDRTGQVSDGFIRFRGTIFATEMERSDWALWYNEPIQINYNHWRGIMDYTIDLDDFSRLLPHPLHVLHVLPVRDESDKERFKINGLLLHPARRVKGTYKALGIFEAFGEHARQTFTIREGQIDIDRGLYEEQNAGVITLV